MSSPFNGLPVNGGCKQLTAASSTVQNATKLLFDDVRNISGIKGIACLLHYLKTVFSCLGSLLTGLTFNEQQEYW